MDIKIISQKEDLFFNRTFILAEVEHKKEPTPKINDVKQALAKLLNASPDLIVIRRCKTGFGFKAKCEAILYKTAEDLQKYEPKPKKKTKAKTTEPAK
jgi:ribosomal protein S24E